MIDPALTMTIETGTVAMTIETGTVATTAETDIDSTG